MKYLFLLLLLVGCSHDVEQVNHYGYAPSIMYKDGTYFAYFCSSGVDGWDAIRLVTSSDRKTWSMPQVVLGSKGTDRCACDPSIVFFKGYYYLFYSGNIENIQTANFVSRSLSPYGPFVKYGNGRWGEVDNPMPIVLPKDPTPDGPGSLYGAGQPTVIVRGNTLMQWYTDVEKIPGGYVHKIKFTTSEDGIVWTPAVETNLNTASIDVKFNAKTGKLNMFGIVYNGQTGIGLYESDDGITWSNPEVLAYVNAYAHNPGVSGNELGELLDNPFVGYGAPRDLNATVDSWPNWNMFSVDLQTLEINTMVYTR